MQNGSVSRHYLYLELVNENVKWEDHADYIRHKIHKKLGLLQRIHLAYQ